MTTKELNVFLLHYLREDKTQTAIMLTGEWGSGKTYYIENELVPFFKENDAKVVVVSLYGIDDTSMISKSIYMELRMSTLGGKYPETITTGKVIAKNVLKNITGLAGIDLKLSDEDLKVLYESVNLKNKMVIFEDIERSNINFINLLGYVNGLVERDGVKVLLVANENEILKKTEPQIELVFSESAHKGDDNAKKEELSEDVKEYLRMKEKTIGDTIQFNGDIEFAVEEIIKKFQNEKLNKLFLDNHEMYKVVANTVCNICRKNLRTLIYAIQKTVDIIDWMNSDSNMVYSDDFYKCLLIGNISLASKIKSYEFPRWEGDEYLSTKLGTNDMPLMRFAYDYIRWQSFDLSLVPRVYEAFNNFRLLEMNAEYRDPDLRILNHYNRETQENVLAALNHIEQKLDNPNAIGIHAYCKLSYYLIYVGTQVGFDYSKSCNLMIRNAKSIGKKIITDPDVFFSHTYSIEEEEIKEEYKAFLKKLSEAVSYENNQEKFSYYPSDIEQLYDDVCKNKYHYIAGHRFLSKYNQYKIIEMLMMSNSGQLEDFRGILLAVYRDTGIGEFDEQDIEAMQLLLQLIQEKKNGDNPWDKIQLMQVKWLESNLKEFIQKMS